MALSNRNLEPGTRLAARYKGEAHRAEVVAGEDGKVRYRLPDGREFASPSAAGSAVMGGVACNGWRFWSLEGEEGAEPKPKAKKAATKTKSAPRGGRAKAKATKARERKAETVACGDCGEKFPSSREAAAHMRDKHGSVEAHGTGG